jgi:hypothetical protein
MLWKMLIESKLKLINLTKFLVNFIFENSRKSLGCVFKIPLYLPWIVEWMNELWKNCFSMKFSCILLKLDKLNYQNYKLYLVDLWSKHSAIILSGFIRDVSVYIKIFDSCYHHLKLVFSRIAYTSDLSKYVEK